MELELGLKLRRAADDFMSGLQITKDRAGPLFLSRETDAMFILTAHLKGYKRENIKIDINEDGTLITISGERQLKETVIVGWEVYEQETDTKGFKKVFRIPDGVILDEIEASYNEDESSLKITMPKNVIGIRGANIEEIEEKMELVGEGSSNLKTGDENANSQIIGTSGRENDENAADKMPKKEKREDDRDVHDLKNREEVDGKQETYEHEQDAHEHKSLVRDNENVGEVGKRCKMCVPIVAGSAFLLSLVVFVFQMVRNKKQISRNRD